jgi:hypothetical protein
MLTDGLYGLTIQRGRRPPRKPAASAEALAVLRNGTILGSGPWGGLFSGTYAVDAMTGQDVFKLQIDVPPNGTLVNGFTAGPGGASFDVVAAFDQASKSHRAKARRAKIEIAGKPLHVAIDFIGPIPS